MKLTALLALSLISSSVMADVLSTGQATMAVGVVTASPLLSSATIVGSCKTGEDVVSGGRISNGERIYTCLMALGTTSSTIALLKEEALQVETDAYAFLAGEEMTLALEELVEKAIGEIPGLADFSDEEIVASLISL